MKWISLTKLLIVLFCISHIAYLFYGLFSGDLGVNPVEVLTHISGEWALYFLLATLAMTPLRKIFRWNKLIRLRRLLGLCSFLYAFIHLSVFVFFDHFFDVWGMLEDIIKRPYITVGFAAFLVLFVLAITSFSALQRRLGKQWVRLHRSVYLAAILVIVHYWWLVKADIVAPLLYATLLAILLFIRLYYFYVSTRSVSQSTR